MSNVSVFVGGDRIDQLGPDHKEWLIAVFARRWAQRRLGAREVQLRNANDPANGRADADLSTVQTKGSFYEQ